MKESIFKAYDIRGVYPDEINEEAAYRIGLAFANFTGAKNVFVGEDARTSTPQLKENLIKGLHASGVNVFLAGALTTPMFYFGVADGKKYDAGIMITASHNPGKYNGFKMVRSDALPIGQGSGMEEIKKLAMEGNLDESGKGETEDVEIKNAYIEKVLSLVNIDEIKKLKVVIDSGNGMAGVILPNLLEKLPQLEVEKLFFDIDMSFPNHEANPLKEETLDALKAKVKEVHADLGVSYDGDADRIGFVDEKGDLLRADYVLALMLPELIKPGETALYDLRCSKVVPEVAEKLGAKTKMTRVGHAFIKKDLRATGAIVAGELSSHFYFKDFYGVESSDLVMLYVLHKLSKSGKTLSELSSNLKKYYQSGEINFEVEDKDEKINSLKEKYEVGASDVSELDGIRIELKNEDGSWWWFNVRASNTEPLLRLNVEASTKELLEEKLKELSDFIKS